MMKPCFGERWSVFVSANVSPQILFLTAGELGIPQNSHATPAEMAQIRKTEADAAMTFLHASVTFLNFPDLCLSFIPYEQIISTVLPLIREYQTDAIFSFHPQETTPFFDHPDHNAAGTIAKYVGAAADVSHFMPESPALKKRPELLLWTTQSHYHQHVVPLDESVRKNRNEYLINHYPSQFSNDSQTEWITIFDHISHVHNGQHQERYIKVR